MRLAGYVLLAVLLLATALLWPRSPDQHGPLLQPTNPPRVDHSISQVQLAPVEVATQRAPAPDPVMEVDPADYPQQDATFPAPPTELDPELRGIEVAGTLTVSPAWKDVKPHVILCRVGSTDSDIVGAQPDRTHPEVTPNENTSRWRARVQGAGRYWIGTANPAMTMEIEVPGNLHDVRIVVPDPIEMECLVVDARTQEPVSDVRMEYQSRVSSLGYRAERVVSDPGTPGMYRWRCAPGDGVIICRARILAYEDQRIDWTPSAYDRTARIELVKATSIRARIFVQGESKASKDAVTTKACAGLVLEKSGVVLPWKGMRRAFSRDSVVITGLSADVYVVRVADPPDGFRAPLPQTVLVSEHVCSEVVFELERE